MAILLPIVGQDVSMWGLIVLGLVAGLLAGFFGVGGGFLMAPLLNIVFGIPYNAAVGSDLAQMLGMSVAGTARHLGLGNVDYKLGGLMTVGNLLSIEFGARLVEALKARGTMNVGGREVHALDFYLPLAFIVLLFIVATMAFRESREALKRAPRGGIVETEASRTARRLSFPPFFTSPTSGIERLSIWVPIGLGLATGVLTGFMGVGGGFVVVPALIYGLSIPTPVAIGTSLFCILFKSAYGCFTHTLKGNVDILLALILLLGSTVGAQIGALGTRRFRGAHIRYYFSIVLYLAALLVAVKLLAKVGLLWA